MLSLTCGETSPKLQAVTSLQTLLATQHQLLVSPFGPLVQLSRPTSRTRRLYRLVFSTFGQSSLGTACGSYSAIQSAMRARCSQFDALLFSTFLKNRLLLSLTASCCSQLSYPACTDLLLRKENT